MSITQAAIAAIWPQPPRDKPHYRLRVNLEDAKPLWWVEKRVPLGVLGGYVRRPSTGGYMTSAAAIGAAVRL